MKFKLKDPPKKGDIRIVKKFAWFPKVIDNHFVWLSTYFAGYKYYEYMDEYGLTKTLKCDCELVSLNHIQYDETTETFTSSATAHNQQVIKDQLGIK